MLKSYKKISSLGKAAGIVAVGLVLFASPFLHAQETAAPQATPVAPSAASAAPISGTGAPLPVNPAPVPPTSVPGMVTGTAIPTPPPATALSPDANKLAEQAEEAALQAQAQQEAEQARLEQEHNRESYNRAASGLLPLTPDQIRDFMRRLEATQEAAQPPAGGPPKGEVRVTTLTLAPGVDPPQINLAAGYVTTITMVDASGQPWPILDVGVGGNFEVSPTQASSHVVRVMPLTRYGTGDLSILLKDLPTPVIFRLVAGGPTVDLRYDARVPKFGPGAKVPLIERPRLEAGNQTIMMLLDNAPPKDAKRLHVSGVDERTMAWMFDDHVFVRTPLTLLSPAWDASVSSADGMTVYEIGDAPVLLMSDNGAMVRARILRDDDHDKQP